MFNRVDIKLTSDPLLSFFLHIISPPGYLHRSLNLLIIFTPLGRC